MASIAKTTTANDLMATLATIEAGIAEIDILIAKIDILLAKIREVERSASAVQALRQHIQDWERTI